MAFLISVFSPGVKHNGRAVLLHEN